MSTAIVNYDPTSFSELDAFAKRICSTGMVPTNFRGKPDEAMVAILFGAEIGLRPLTSLQYCAVINGRPAIYGDAMPGLALDKGLITNIREWKEGEPNTDTWVAVCQVTRPNGSVVEQRFSVADAKKASLWGKAGPWTQYAGRMLQMRARSFAIRDAAPNLLFGNSAEELQDIDTSEQRGPETARDITPKSEPAQSPKREAAEAIETVQPVEDADDNDPIRITGLSGKEAIGAIQWALEDADAKEADRLWQLYRDRVRKLSTKAFDALEAMVLEKIQNLPANGAGVSDDQPALV